MSALAQMRIHNAERCAARFLEISLIYFIQSDCPNGYIKIGWGEAPARRLAILQVGCPYPLKLLGTMAGGFTDERAIHERFKDARVQGEWFKPTSELLAFIEANKQASDL